MQNAPTPPARPPPTPGSASASAAYAHPALPMLSSLGPPGTMHAANGAPLPPFIPEGGAPTSSWFSSSSAHALQGYPSGSASGRSTPGSGSGRSANAKIAGGRTARGGSTGWIPAGANRLVSGHYSGAEGHAGMGLDMDGSANDIGLAGATHEELIHAAHAAQAASSTTPNGPPFICAACKQTYSRLEYLRRHERRHADIRPFVCDCGKGFSRSDVLSRHKKQCKIVIGENGNKEGDSSNDRDQAAPPAKRQRRSTGGRKKKASEQQDQLDQSQHDFQHQSHADRSPDSSSHDLNHNIDPALVGLGQAPLINQELASQQHHNSGVFHHAADYADPTIGYEPDATMSYQYPPAPAPAPGPAPTSAESTHPLTTSADVANVASVALAELAAAATMLPNQNTEIAPSGLVNAYSAHGMNHRRSQTMPEGSGAGSKSGSGSGSGSGSSMSVEDAGTSPTPEQALLRVTGGSQEFRAGINDMQVQHAWFHPALEMNGAAQVAMSENGLKMGQGPSGSLATSNSLSSHNNNSMEWLLSPSIQQLLAWSNAAATGGSSTMASEGSGFSYFRSMPGLSHTSSSTSLSFPTLSDDLAAIAGMAPGESLGDLQAAFGHSMSSAAAAAASVNGSLLGVVSADGSFGGAGTGACLSGAAAAIANGIAAESQPSLATVMATVNRPSVFNCRKAFSEGLALDLQKAFADSRNPFFIPQHLFRACYSIPHWDLPPLTRLSMLAFHCQKNLLKHFPFIHEPTFRIDTTPGCVAFAICMLGSSDIGRKWWAGEDVLPRPEGARIIDTSDVEGRSYDEDDGQVLVRPLVMDEKMDMLFRVFAARCKNVMDQIAAVQSLSLLQWKALLSPDPARRAHAARVQQKVTGYARQSGLFDVNAGWADRRITFTAAQVLDSMLSEAAELCFSYSFLPTYLPGCPDEEKVWRRWSEWEGRRRTAFILFVIDTVAYLDTGASMALGSHEVEHLPLPSPDYLWRSTTPERWFVQLENYSGPTLAQALQQLLGPGNEQILSPGGAPSISGAHGPFARLVMMLALLRGILALMDGRHNRVARPSPLSRYFGAPLAPDGGRSELRIFKHALVRWRKAWDGDVMCKNVGWVQRWDDPSWLETGDGMHIDSDDSASSSRASGSSPMFSSRTSHGVTPLCDDALPFYWLCHVLLDHVSRGKKLPQRPVGSTVAAGEQESPSGKSKGASSKAGSSPVESGATVPDFRVLLKLAKQYVSGGAEGNPVDWPAIPLELFSTST